MRFQARLQRRKMALVADSAANVGDTSRRVGHRLYLTLARRGSDCVLRPALSGDRARHRHYIGIAREIPDPSAIRCSSPLVLVGIGHD